MLVATFRGRGVSGFTLDATIGGFVATHPDLRIPSRGAATRSAGACCDTTLRIRAQMFAAKVSATAAFHSLPDQDQLYV